MKLQDARVLSMQDLRNEYCNCTCTHFIKPVTFRIIRWIKFALLIRDTNPKRFRFCRNIIDKHTGSIVIGGFKYYWQTNEILIVCNIRLIAPMLGFQVNSCPANLQKLLTANYKTECCVLADKYNSLQFATMSLAIKLHETNLLLGKKKRKYLEAQIFRLA